MSLINLCSVPELSNDYQNVIDFNSLSAQLSYFNNKRVLTPFEANIINDGTRETITIQKTLTDLRQVDYLFFIGTDNKTYYYFINKKISKLSSATILEIELDVFQTYMFDYTLLDSYVDRCHVNRWNGAIPTKELTDEGLPIGEYIIRDIDDILTQNRNYIMVTTSPLGLTDLSEAPQGGGTGSTSAVVTSALKIIGKPYVLGDNYSPLHLQYGGSGTATDCSGYCQWAYNDAGLLSQVGLGGRWTTYTMIEHGTARTLAQAVPGDVIFCNFSSPGVPEHVMILEEVTVDGKIKCLEAANESLGIIRSTYTYNSTLHDIRRLL